MKHRFFKYYAVPLLLLSVACVQLFLVGKGLNRWRGGGFGMYSEFHYSDTVVLIKSAKGSAARQDSIVLADSIPRSLVQSVGIFPHEPSVKKLAAQVASKIKHDSFLIEVWKPSLDMDSLIYRRKLILRYSHENQRFER